MTINQASRIYARMDGLRAAGVRIRAHHYGLDGYDDTAAIILAVRDEQNGLPLPQDAGVQLIY